MHKNAESYRGCAHVLSNTSIYRHTTKRATATDGTVDAYPRRGGALLSWEVWVSAGAGSCCWNEERGEVLQKTDLSRDENPARIRW